MSAPGRHVGDLSRGAEQWQVYLETVPDLEVRAVRGRIHFVGAAEARSTTWIFLERREQDVDARFSELSALELWSFVEALAP